MAEVVDRYKLWSGYNPSNAQLTGIDAAKLSGQSATQDAMVRRAQKQATAKAAADAAYQQQLATTQRAAEAALVKRQAAAEKKAAATAAANQKKFEDAMRAVAPASGGVSAGVRPVSGSSNVAGGNTAKWGNPRQAGWASNNLVTIKQGKVRVTVNRQAANAFQGFLRELTAKGYNAGTVQGYNLRGKRSNPSSLSEHAFGTAIDINPGQNPANFNGVLHTNMPTWVGALAAKYGLLWGGNWKRMPDPMHFEYKKQ